MKIYTKTGDDGMTSLIGGKRVSKDNPQVEAYGDVDELTCHLGLLIALLEKNNISHPQQVEIHQSLLRIQRVLMFVGAYFATPADGTQKNIKESDYAEIEWLEGEIDKMSDKMNPLKAFVLPGAPIQSAECHVARTICRRCERRSVTLCAENKNVTDNLEFSRKYLNRLSDYLFTLARYFCFLTDTPEEFWIP